MSFLGNSSKTKSMSPYLATAFLLLSFAAREASGQFFRGRQFGRQIGGGAAGSNSGEECGSGQYTHFELVTGQVYTAPDDMLDSRPGTLMLTDCIDLCRNNASCRAANFETGLCVLFSSSAREFPGGLTVSQFPVFTLYLQKVCLPLPPCPRAWSFESVQDYAMLDYIRKSGRVPSRDGCMALCLAEEDFPCRSVSYNRQTGECRLSDMDRHTVAGTLVWAQSQGDEFMENNCVDDPVKLCDFQLLENRIMKTVDSVYQDVPAMEACRDLCLTAPYRCHSFDYGDTGDRVCRLSHHATATLSEIQDPFLIIGNVRGTFELSSCYNVTIDCRSSEMVATITTNKIFTGKLYAKESPNSCVVDVQGDIEFSISMAYNDLECNVQREREGVYTNQVIIQHHDSVVTSSDLGLALHCQYDLTNRTVNNGVDLEVKGEIEPSLLEEGVVESPNVVMRVSALGGEPVVEAAVGDSLELHFSILDPENSPYEIFVRELIAKDGNDQNEIMLLDSDGCPTESRILGPLVREEDVVKSLVAKFDAFKFPTSEVVQFRALVTPCMPSCEPVKCVYNDYSIGKQTNVDSYGRRRRRDMSFSENPLTKWLANAERSRKVRSVQGGVVGKDLLVTHAFTITDKFAKKEKNMPKKSTPIPHVNNDISSEINIDEIQQFIPNEIARERYFNNANDVAFTNQPKSDSFGPTIQEEPFEVCLNLTGVVVGVGIFVVTQIASVLAWTHFWHTRQKKMKRSQFRS